ncbi:DUF2269 family protein [Cohnella pontilimi]|uniref:DUF2269 family protein n=1 Tax=Cohnella pontilimi TaxID=2564100 RepID=UPI00145DC4B9|nr:DUF2269 family protein [Cohnella pontilimi]
MGVLFDLLIVLHVLAAIVGIGPAFILPVLGKSAKSGSQLRFIFGIIQKVNKFPKIGGITLLVTGVLLMIVSKIGFSLVWLNISLLLFLLIEILIIGFVEPRMKRTTHLVLSSEGEDIPSGFAESMKQIAPLESTVHLFTFAIIALMVLKPF